MPYVRPFAVHCDRCSAIVSLNATDRHAAAAELGASGWLPCPRKGGKLAGMCPKCRPDPMAASTVPTRSTGDMSPIPDEASAAAIVWSVRRLLPPGRLVTFVALEREFCRRCGRDRDACACA